MRTLGSGVAHEAKIQMLNRITSPGTIILEFIRLSYLKSEFIVQHPRIAFIRIAQLWIIAWYKIIHHRKDQRQ
jgi:hypothetical protein